MLTPCKNRWFWPPYSHLRPLRTEPPWIPSWALYRLQVESLGYTFAAASASIFFQVSVVSSKRRIISAFGWNKDKAVQSHPRSLILVVIERAYVTSCYWLIVTFALSRTASEIRQLIGWKSKTFPTTPLSFDRPRSGDPIRISGNT